MPHLRLSFRDWRSAVGGKAETWVAKDMMHWAGTKSDIWSSCLILLAACNASRCIRFMSASLSAIDCACLRLRGACVPSCWAVLLGHMECGSTSTRFQGASAWASTRPQPQVKYAAEGSTCHKHDKSTERSTSILTVAITGD